MTSRCCCTVLFPLKSSDSTEISYIAPHPPVATEQGSQEVTKYCMLSRRGGGYSLYSDDRDNFLGLVIGNLVFLGVVQAKSIKKIKPVFVRV